MRVKPIVGLNSILARVTAILTPNLPTQSSTNNNAHVFAISILMGRVCNAATDRLDEGMGAFDEMKRFSVECVFLEV